MATKTDIRRDIRQLKRMLTDEQKAIAASKCFSRLEQCQEFIDADRILVYASLPDEISTDAFISRWYGRKQIFLPRVNGDDLDILDICFDEPHEICCEKLVDYANGNGGHDNVSVALITL